MSYHGPKNSHALSANNAYIGAVLLLSPASLYRPYWRSILPLFEHMKPGEIQFLLWDYGQIRCPQLSLLLKILTSPQFEVMGRSWHIASTG